jgi:hypothetical protein
MVMHRWDPLYEEQYRPRGKRAKPPKPGRKRKKLLRRLAWYAQYPSPDIDMMKPETLSGRFCACGARTTEVCYKCLDDGEM